MVTKSLRSSAASSSLMYCSDGVVITFSFIVLGLFALGLIVSIWSLPSPDNHHDGLSLLNLHTIRHLARRSNVHSRFLDDDVHKVTDDQLDDELSMLHEEGFTLHDMGNNFGKPISQIRRDNRVQQETNNAVIPQAKWPVSIRDEDGYFEDIAHPGHRAKNHPDVIMTVPRFWIDDPVAIHQNKLMTRELAMKIGSCAIADEKGNHARGDECPVNERTIYVAIASYRDYQCRDTVDSLLSTAKYPERIRVGVIDQIDDGEDIPCDQPAAPCSNNGEQQMLCKYKNHIDVLRVDTLLSVGPVFARHLGHRLYRGEYYTMQIDSHVTFARNWDVDIIDQHEATNNEMAVLTTYLSDIQGALDDKGDSLKEGRPIMCASSYEVGQRSRYLRHGTQPESTPQITGSPQLEPFWAAGFSFSRGHFVVNVPYDLYQPLIFQGEEMSIGIRGFTIGYDFYAPWKSVCFHHYGESDTDDAKKRNNVPKYSDHDRMYAGAGIKAMYRMLGIVHMNPEVNPKEWDHTDEIKYGLGGVRTPERFYDIFGIDVVNKKNEGHLCRFVDTGDMHKKFTKALRKDGMGIDYDKIDYKFIDPNPDDDDNMDEDEEEEN